MALSKACKPRKLALRFTPSRKGNSPEDQLFHFNRQLQCLSCSSMLKGRVALITGEALHIYYMTLCQRQHNCCRLTCTAGGAGSTQGIGLGMLRGLAQAGADVVMHGKQAVAVILVIR